MTKYSTVQDVLAEYHKKFDDSKVRELLNQLAAEMSERAAFFHNNNLDLDEDSELFEKLDDYWHPLDHLSYYSAEHDEILDKLRDDALK